MTTRKLSVQQALREVKLTNDRIVTALGKSQFVAVKEKANPTVGGIAVSDFNANAKSTYQQILALLTNYNNLKQAISLSNARTVVTVAGENYTVAEAIAKKDSIGTERNVVQVLKAQLVVANRQAQKIESELTTKADAVAAAFFGTKVDKTGDEYRKFVSDFINDRKADLVDPLGIAEVVEKLELAISNFLSDVDFALTESNVLNYIEVNV